MEFRYVQMSNLSPLFESVKLFDSFQILKTFYLCGPSTLQFASYTAMTNYLMFGISSKFNLIIIIIYQAIVGSDPHSKVIVE